MCPNICTFPHLVVLRGGVTQFPYAMIVYALGRLHCPNLLMLALALTGGAHPVAVVVEVLSKIVSQLLTVVGEINFGLKTGSDSSIQFLMWPTNLCCGAVCSISVYSSSCTVSSISIFSFSNSSLCFLAMS